MISRLACLLFGHAWKAKHVYRYNSLAVMVFHQCPRCGKGQETITYDQGFYRVNTDWARAWVRENPTALLFDS